MKKLVPLAAALALCAMPALANVEGKMMSAEEKADHMLKKMDSNNDGSVSKSEHDAFASKKFDKADTNNDNMLSRDEIAAHKRMEKDEYKTGMGGERGKMSPAAGGSSADTSRETRE